MRRTPVALTVTAVALLLVACVGDRDTTAPKIAPGAPSLAVLPTPVVCDFNAMKTAARAFFSSGSDPVFGLISDMQRAGGAAAATPIGLNIFAEVATARLTSRQETGADAAGGIFVANVALCTNLGTVDPTAAAKALKAGVFEVRGGSLDPQAPALARPDVFPRWGVESKTASWPTAPTAPGQPRYLVYGFPGVSVSELGGEPAAVSSLIGYDVATLSTNVSKSGLRVGFCVKTTVTDENLNGIALNRLIHAGRIEPNSPPTFCSGGPTASLSTSAWFASAAKRVVSMFSPTPLFAEGDDLDLLSFTGGGPSSWSPMAFGKIVGSNSPATFTVQPRDGFVAPRVLPSFTVHAATPGHPIPGVAITVVVFGNSGLPAGAVVSGTVTVHTNVNGDAVFNNVSIAKAGGYTIVANSSLDGVATPSVVSIMFHVKNR